MSTRPARISCISLAEELTTALSIDEKLYKAMELLDLAAYDKPDLMCLPEAFAQYFIPADRWRDIQETIDGRIITAIAQKARQYNCYIICPILLRDAGHIKNTAILLDRKGKPCGRYEKFMPTITEIELGVMPGDCCPVFDTDIGRIGIAICFDLNFWEVGRALHENGVQIIVFASMYEGSFQLRQWAFEFQCYVASSVIGGTSTIINPLGQVVALTSRHHPLITSDINLNYCICHLNGHLEKLKRIKAIYGDTVQIEIITSDAKCMITLNRPDLHIKEIILKFELEIFNHYLDRAKLVKAKALEGE